MALSGPVDRIQICATDVSNVNATGRGNQGCPECRGREVGDCSNEFIRTVDDKFNAESQKRLAFLTPQLSFEKTFNRAARQT